MLNLEHGKPEIIELNDAELEMVVGGNWLGDASVPSAVPSEMLSMGRRPYLRRLAGPRQPARSVWPGIGPGACRPSELFPRTARESEVASVADLFRLRLRAAVPEGGLVPLKPRR